MFLINLSVNAGIVGKSVRTQSSHQSSIIFSGRAVWRERERVAVWWVGVVCRVRQVQRARRWRATNRHSPRLITPSAVNRISPSGSPQATRRHRRRPSPHRLATLPTRRQPARLACRATRLPSSPTSPTRKRATPASFLAHSGKGSISFFPNSSIQRTQPLTIKAPSARFTSRR